MLLCCFYICIGFYVCIFEISSMYVFTSLLCTTYYSKPLDVTTQVHTEVPGWTEIIAFSKFAGFLSRWLVQHSQTMESCHILPPLTTSFVKKTHIRALHKRASESFFYASAVSCINLHNFYIILWTFLQSKGIEWKIGK